MTLTLPMPDSTPPVPPCDSHPVETAPEVLSEPAQPKRRFRPWASICRGWRWISAGVQRVLGVGWRQSWAVALGVYILVCGVYFATASRQVVLEHTSCNHFSHLARAWLDGRLDLKNGPPSYAQNNDFAHYANKWYVAFPPFPAFVLLPFVAFAREPELVRDGQVFLWIAGLGPGLLFMGLERLRRLGRSPRGIWENAFLALTFAFGTVFFFTAVQGTVWFAAHVVGVALAAGYLFLALEASFPLLAGLCIGLGTLTRTPLLFAVPLFLYEALRVSGALNRVSRASVGAGYWQAAVQYLRQIAWRRLIKLLFWFSVPVVVCVGISCWNNYVRFGSPFETGYQYLTVAWQTRMKKWGLFHFHYLPRNLGVVFSQLPWPEPGKWRFRINVHGLALWFTTPLYLWLLWPKQVKAPHVALWLTVAAVAVPTLFYQNTGWSQFGYRFSNDYAVFLFALLAIGARPIRGLMLAAVTFALVVNAFGAFTFGRGEYARYYYSDPSQQKYYQPD